MKGLCFNLLGKKGYVYTVITAALVLVSLSLILFYFQTSETKIEDIERKIALEELHYFVDGIKHDYAKMLEISGTRAIIYAISHILNSSENFDGYEMIQCNDFRYTVKGSQSAISELMLCGTLNGEKIEEMQNNTLLNWTQRILQINEFEIENLEIKNITLVMYDSFTIAVISELELSVTDKGNFAEFDSNITVISLISILGLEDPLYMIETNESDLIRKFKECNETESYEEINGTVIDEWINLKCYHESNLSYNGSSFFDRLDGSLNLSEKYLNQSWKYFSVKDIGLESFVNVYEFFLHNTSINLEENYTWVDYLYWQDIKRDCKVNYTQEYPINDTYNITFGIDILHKEKYNISGSECE